MMQSVTLILSVVIAQYGLTEGYLKVSLLNTFSYRSDATTVTHKYFKCFISETDLDGVSVTAERVSYTRNGGWRNPAPYPPTKDNQRTFNVYLQSSSNKAFGVYACEVTLGSSTTSVQTILLRSTAEIVPSDRLLTKTVNIGDTGVNLEMDELVEVEVEVEWRHNASDTFSQQQTRIPIPRGNRLLRATDGGVYECHHANRRDEALHGIQRLIIRACSPGRWGPPSCSRVCNNCYNGGVCEDNTGDCICPAGFMGQNCLTACPHGKFGFECEFFCKESNTGRFPCREAMICLPDPFGCRCASGFEGLGCETSCEEGRFGANCLQTCHCSTGSDCDAATGVCASGQCSNGFTGVNCQVCEDGLFGEGCNQSCNCQVTCDKMRGSCPGECKTSWVTIEGEQAHCQTGIVYITYTRVNPGAVVDVRCTLFSPQSIQSLTAALYRVTSGGQDQYIAARRDVNTLSDRTRSIVTMSSSEIDEGDTVACKLFSRNRLYNDAFRVTTVSFFVLPILPSAPRLTSVSNTSITVEWMPWIKGSDVGDPPLDGYKTYLRRAGSLEVIASEEVSKATTQLTFDTLEPDTDYDITVAAVREGANGEGPETKSTGSTSCSSPPVAPINMTITEVEGQGVNVTWENPDEEAVRCRAGVTMFTVYYKPLDVDLELTHSINEASASSTLINMNLEAGKNYSFQMTLMTSGGESPRSEELHLVITVPVENVKDTSKGDGSGSPIGLILALILVLIVIALVIIILVIRRKRNSESTKPPRSAVAPNRSSRRNPAYDTVTPGNENTYANHDMDVGTNGRPQASAPPPPVLTKKPPVVVEEWNEDEDAPAQEEEENLYGNLETPQAVKVADLPGYVAERTKSKTDSLIHQFMILPKDERYPCTAGKLEENKKKNRFRNMLAYDKTRVVLEKLLNDPHSDYYNACYMKDQNGKVAFIASQGPNKASMNDYWRMIWMTDVSIIVMVTNLIEGGKDRCTQYWPDKERQSKQWGDITVSWAGTQNFANHVIRKLTVTQGDVQRSVCQYHFVTWPDMGVPAEPTALISLVRQVKRQNQGKTAPILVHCSAGIGRTGTFIALYCLTEVLKKEKYINVYEFVEKMREDRINMVQTGVQYQFLYDALVEVYLTSHTEIPTGLLTGFNINSKKQLLQEEFQLLNTLSKKMKPKKCNAGQDPTNVVKNRFPDIIPPDGNRPFVSSGGGFKENDYINGTFISTYGKKDAFITTQSPLPHTIEAFWRLVCDWKVPAIIMLNQVDGKQKRCPCYWPEGESSNYGSVTVKTLATENLGSFTCRRFEITQQGQQQARCVEHFQLLSWPDPEECPSGLAQMLHSVVEVLLKQPSPPGIIQCIDGVGCSGSVAVVLSEIDRIRQDDRVDIFQSSRQLRTANSHFLHKEHHYILCYKILQEYMGLETEYGNI